ncbi:hypothetical protein I317_00187 [Kwoniella heveanensis CBS 569]|nr:hypothetical protein I317_00187 [Kwoniella heveanensis CBS 569]
MDFTSGPNHDNGQNQNNHNPYPAMTHPVHQASSVPVPASYGQREMYIPPSTIPMSNGLAMVNPPDIAMLARQGYLQQQQQLVALGQYGHPTIIPSRDLPPSETAQIYGITPQMQQEHLQRSIQQAQAQQRAQQQQQQQQQHASQGGSGSGTGTGKKKRGPKPSAGAQMISRQTTNMQPPHSSEHYIKNALSAPPQPSASHPSALSGGSGAAVLPSGEPVEPWADALDELDPRELAMGRYRRRHEVLGEVFGPESIKDIPTGKYDPWAGLGMDGETLEAKVLALEKENAELEAKVQQDVSAFKKKLADIDAGLVADYQSATTSTSTATGVMAV